jgi:hypothetical protein
LLDGGLSLTIFTIDEAFSIIFSFPFLVVSIPSFEVTIGVKSLAVML